MQIQIWVIALFPEKKTVNKTRKLKCYNHEFLNTGSAFSDFYLGQELDWQPSDIDSGCWKGSLLVVALFLE